jgi:membrane protease subunit HflK
MEEANGHRQRVIATAEGDASRFKQVQVEYAKAPEVTRQRMYLETMQQVYSNTSKVMVDAKGQGNLLYLPLDKLMQATAAVNAAQSGVPEVASTQSVAPKAAPAQSDVPPQVDRSLNNTETRREPSLRSRDRESR